MVEAAVPGSGECSCLPTRSEEHRKPQQPFAGKIQPFDIPLALLDFF
jgi:hypothetical protein